VTPCATRQGFGILRKGKSWAYVNSLNERKTQYSRRPGPSRLGATPDISASRAVLTRGRGHEVDIGMHDRVQLHERYDSDSAKEQARRTNCNESNPQMASVQATQTSMQPYTHALHHVTTVTQSSRVQLPSRAQASSRVRWYYMLANREAVRSTQALSAHTVGSTCNVHAGAVSTKLWTCRYTSIPTTRDVGLPRP
jgi:hypothetical protein